MRVKTPTVGATTLAILALLPPSFACAEEIFRQTQDVSCLPDGSGCTTFQGYIYVRRDGEVAPAPASNSARSDAGLSERRLYLHMGASDSP
jgi:hypothetical protein